MKVGTLLDPHMQMCMKIGCSGPLTFSRVMALLDLEIFTLCIMQLVIATPLIWFVGYTWKLVHC